MHDKVLPIMDVYFEMLHVKNQCTICMSMCWKKNKQTIVFL